MKIIIDTIYKVYGNAEVELPEGKTKDDIEKIWMKMGDGFIEFKDQTFLQIEDELHKNMEEDQFYLYELCKRPNEISFDELKEK